MSEQELVRAVTKITGLFESLAQKKELGVTELARLLGMHKSTVFRFLNSLKKLGYVSQILLMKNTA